MTTPAGDAERDGERDREQAAERVREQAAGQAAERDGEPTAGPSSERDWNAEWAALTSDLEPPSAPSLAPRAGSSAGSFGRPVYRMSDVPVTGAGSGPRDYTPAPEDDAWEPDLPPQRPMNRLTALAWAAIAGGPLLMLLALLGFGSAPPWYVAACVALFVTGCVLGFARLPRRHDGDDGAEV